MALLVGESRGASRSSGQIEAAQPDVEDGGRIWGRGGFQGGGKKCQNMYELHFDERRIGGQGGKKEGVSQGKIKTSEYVPSARFDERARTTKDGKAVARISRKEGHL